MASHFADLTEHAIDVFGDRIAVACGDRQVTYAELEERANRLAHHLAGLGVGPGDHVGLYARNSIPALETLVAACKLRAGPININYRYTENELRHLAADADLAALVHDREYGPLVAAVRPEGLRGTVVIGMPRWVVASMVCARCVVTPSSRCSPGAVTSGGGAAPLRIPQRYAAARPLRTAWSPQAQTAAR